jgi:predicted acyl esterase
MIVIKKNIFVVFLTVIVFSFLFCTLGPLPATGLDLEGGIRTTIESPWSPPGRCPKYFTGGWHIDPNDLGYPLPQGVCVDGEWMEEGIIVERDVSVAMRDGVVLRANVYRPKKTGKFPVVMSFTPYTKAVAGWGKTAGVYHYMLSNETSFEFADPGFWVPHDYVVVLVDARGYGNSPGERLSLETDYYDGVEWAGTREWSNGNVGMIGISALAIVQWYAAQLNPPHLKAIIPWEGTTYLPTPRYGGIKEHGFFQSIAVRGGTLPPDPKKNQSKRAQMRPDEPLAFEKITVPALVCATWSDLELHNRGTLWGFRKISSEYKWLYTHAGRKWSRFYDPDAEAFQKMFFDYFLKGSDTRILSAPRVRLEVRETLDKYAVRYEDDFPIPRTRYEKIYLDAKKGSMDLKLVQQAGKVSYNSETSSGKAIFDYIFDADTELTGYMKLHLRVSPQDSDDMDIFVTLKKLDSNGNDVLFDGCHAPRRTPVSLGWLRLSKRELDPKLSTPWNPIQDFSIEKKVKPGEIVPADIEILASSTLFRKGETLRLIISGKTQVQSTRFRYDDINKGAHLAYAGGKYDSYLQIPIVPPKKIETK